MSRGMKKRVAGLPVPTEHQSQVALFRRISLHPRTKDLPIFAIPNGGARHINVARKLKAEGVRAGVPDIFCAVPKEQIVSWSSTDPRTVGNGGYTQTLAHGLFIEMKRPKKKPTPAQKAWHVTLGERGYLVEVCEGMDDAWHTLCAYLGLSIDERPLTPASPEQRKR